MLTAMALNKRCQQILIVYEEVYFIYQRHYGAAKCTHIFIFPQINSSRIVFEPYILLMIA